MKIFNKKGFTLIELLVVISIIGLLSSVVLSSLNTARAKARDTQRIRTLTELRTALNLYYADNGYYPVCGGYLDYCSSNSGFGGSMSSWTELTPNYIKSITNDPVNTAGQYEYYYWSKLIPTSSNTAVSSDSQHYILMTRLERTSNPTVSINGSSFSGNSSVNYLMGQ